MLADKPLPSERATGIGVAAFNMALALARRGITVRYVCRGTTESTEAFSDGLTIQTIKRFSRDNLSASLSIIKEGGCDLMHVHSSAAAPSFVAARALGRPAVFHSHSDQPLHPLGLTLVRNVEMSLSQRVIAVSENTRRQIIRNHHVPPSKVVVAYNGVNTREFSPAPPSSSVLRAYGLDPSDTILLSIGRVQKSKGQWMIIESMREMLKHVPGLVYVNAGPAEDSSYQGQMMGRIEGLGLSKSVRLLGNVPQGDLVSLVNSATLCVHTSLREAFPLAILEEMACGKAVIAFSVDPMTEIIENGVDGLLIGPGSVKDLGGSIVDALSDRRLIQRIGAAARAKVSSRFTWERTASRLEEIYNEIHSRTR